VNGNADVRALEAVALNRHPLRIGDQDAGPLVHLSAAAHDPEVANGDVRPADPDHLAVSAAVQGHRAVRDQGQRPIHLQVHAVRPGRDPNLVAGRGGRHCGGQVEVRSIPRDRRHPRGAHLHQRPAEDDLHVVAGNGPHPADDHQGHGHNPGANLPAE